jgi:hypothetical protein
MNGQTNKGKSKSKNPNKEKTNAKTLDSASRLIEGWGKSSFEGTVCPQGIGLRQKYAWRGSATSGDVQLFNLGAEVR